MIRNNYFKRLPLKNNNKKKVRPHFCFVRPKWRLGRTYVLSRKEKLFAALEVYRINISYKCDTAHN